MVYLSQDIYIPGTSYIYGIYGIYDIYMVHMVYIYVYGTYGIYLGWEVGLGSAGSSAQSWYRFCFCFCFCRELDDHGIVFVFVFGGQV